jgi:hypothetical protein
MSNAVVQYYSQSQGTSTNTTTRTVKAAIVSFRLPPSSDSYLVASGNYSDLSLLDLYENLFSSNHPLRQPKHFPWEAKVQIE